MTHTPYIVGLTGGIASGKTTAADYLISKGILAVDADKVARQVVAVSTPTYQAIVDLLGVDFLNADKTLNRSKIKALIFSDEKIKAAYEAIILPAIRQAILDELAQTKARAVAAFHPYLLLIVPLLFEKGLDTYCDKTVVIDIDEKTQFTRLLTRDAISKQTAQGIIAAQMSRAMRNQRADFVIENTGDRKALYTALDNLHKILAT